MSRVGREIAERAAVRTSKAARRERFKDFLGAERHGSAAVRPLIAGAPDEIGCGQGFELSVDAEATSVALIRPSSLTHQINTEQRYVELGISRGRGRGSFVVASPPHGAVAPSGWHLLFVVDVHGPR